MSREFQLVSTEPVQDHYFRYDNGIGQSESIKIFLNDSVYVGQIAIQCVTASEIDIEVLLMSGTQYQFASFSGASTNHYLNDGTAYIFWSQLPKGARILITKADTSTTGVLEVSMTTRAVMMKPPGFEKSDVGNFFSPTPFSYQ